MKKTKTGKSNVKSVLKPGGLNFSERITDKGAVYAGLYDEDDRDGRAVYVGGDYYSDTAQIHLNRQEVLQLSKWLNEVVRWMNRAPRNKKRKSK